MFNPLATFVAGQPAALLLFSGSLLWLWASPRTHRWRSFRFVCEKRHWNVELLQDFFKSKAKHAPIWPVPLMNSRVGGRTAALPPVCTCLGWGSVKIWSNDIPTSLGFLSITVSKISGDHCSLSTPGSCSIRRSGLCFTSWSKLYRF